MTGWTVERVVHFGLSDFVQDGIAHFGFAATFGSDPAATFDGPISMAVDDDGNVFVGDRFLHVVRRIDAATGTIDTIAGRPEADDAARNDPSVVDPLALNLPQISSMDYDAGRLYVPPDLEGGLGDLAVLRWAER